ncbi:MAG: holo-ACP synthase [Rhodospirillaceae bacterium TMED8]|nr:holo-ACP synthase [Magnetovibrio sp.]OUT51640.1 MAG: holo-ACP synthase [Rhodospirillaceae bacterium TMED8]|tara:strand:+ start:590 stop:1009 length:420 start_codon:yes stop_codon:yes gene_type:complete
MIIGIGTDLCDMRRIEKTLERFSSKFTNRLFTDVEQAKASRRQNPAFSYAQSFAAKEACAKALGTGLRQGVFWRDMSVQNLPTGQPYMKLSGGALKRLHSLIPHGMRANIFVTQTDEYPIASAFVIIEAVLLGEPHNLF